MSLKRPAQRSREASSSEEKSEDGKSSDAELPVAKTLKGLQSAISVKDSSNYDFLWTIESFSLLVRRSKGVHESGPFITYGYKWQVLLYPNGIIDDNTHLSVYIKLLETPSMVRHMKAFRVSFKLSLFDQIYGKHTTYEALRYFSIGSLYGNANFIHLNTFKDSSKGYLVNDACMLGVEISKISPIQTRRERLVAIEDVGHEYTWKIDKFSELAGRTHHDQAFIAGGHKWAIRLYPNGSLGADKYLSLFLCYNGPNGVTSPTKVYVEGTLRLIDQIRGNHRERTFKTVLKTASDYGFKLFISSEDFENPLGEGSWLWMYA